MTDLPAPVTDASESAKAYAGCSDTEKMILGLQLLNCVPMTRRILFGIFTRIAPHALSRMELDEILREMRRRGLIHSDSSGSRCGDGLASLILEDLVARRQLQELSRILDESPPRSNTPLRQRERLYAQAVRDFLITLFRPQKSAVAIEKLEQLWLNFPTESKRYPILQTFLDDPFHPPLLELIPRPVRGRLLIILAWRYELQLRPAAHLITYLEAQNLAAEHALPVFSYLVNAGQLEAAECFLAQHLPKAKDTRVYVLRARLKQLRGDLPAALADYDSGYKIFHRGRSKKQKYLPQNHDSLFYLCAVVAHRDFKLIDKTAELIFASLLKQNHLTDLFVLFLMAFNLVADRDFGYWHYQLSDTPPDHYTNLERFFFYLLLSWLEPERLTEFSANLEELKKATLAFGNRWLAAECALLLAVADSNPDTAAAHRQFGETLHQELHTISLTEICQRREKWEKLIEKLEHLADNQQPQASQPAATQRLIWWLGFTDDLDAYSLTPRVQKLNKSGKWSKGRSAALKTLAREGALLDYLTDHDLRAIQAIHESRNHYYYGRTQYYIDIKQALPALIGHPRLFLQDDPEIRIELVGRQPELIIDQDEAGNYLLRLEPEPEHTELNLVLQQESATRYGLYEFTPELLELCELCYTSPPLPPAAGERLRQTAARLTGVLTIHSNLPEMGVGDADLVTVAGDPRPHLQLLPWRNGLQAEMVAKPGGDEAGIYKPGIGGETIISRSQEGRVAIHRDLKDELARAQAVIASCPTLSQDECGSEDFEWLLPDPESALQLLLELRAVTSEQVTLEWPQGEKFRVTNEFDNKDLSLRISREQDWFRLGGELKINPQLTLNLKQLLERMERTSGRFLPLDENTFIALTDSLRRKLKELAACGEPAKEALKLNPLMQLALPDLEADVGDFSADQAWQELRQRLTEIIDPEPPSTLTAELRDYQVQGFKWLAQLSHWQVGACLADDMGLGKTLQALAVILTRAAAGPTLVCAPLSVLNNWIEECRRFAPTLNPQVFGPGDRAQMLAAAGPFDLLVTSYGLLQKESARLREIEWQSVILDEAQAIKNRQTKRTRAAMQLKAQFRLITTGTPIENHLGELWTLFDFLNPGLLGSRKWFQERFAVPIEKDGDRQRRRELNRLLRPFILRRLKSEVLQELPPKTEITLEVELSPEEASLYAAQRLRALEKLETGDEPGHIQILAEIMKLRRLCCHPRLLLPESRLAGAKLKLFGEIIGELRANRHKALVFSQFVDHLSIMREYLEQQQIPYQYLDGSTPVRQRRERITAFQNGVGELFLISLKAGGSGLNLTAADFVIHMDPWWNPAVEDQASDRAHRIGQTRPVTIYRLITKGTIEEQIVELHQRKRELAGSLLAGTDLAGRLDARELLELLKR